MTNQYNKPLTIRNILYFGFVKLFVFALLFNACSSRQNADILLTNVQLIGADGAIEGDCIAISGDTISATGHFREVKKHWKAAQIIDCQGATVLPGLIDAHAHFYGLALNMTSADLRGTSSPEEVVERLKKFYAENPGQWLTGRGWDQNLWPDGQMPLPAYLDTAFPNIPVYLTRIDGHALWINQAAARLHGITGNEQVTGGKLEKRDGRFTGVLVDEAMKLAPVPKPSMDQLLPYLQKAEQQLFEAGVTSLTDAGLPWEVIDGFRQFYRRGLLRIGLNALAADDDKTFENLLTYGPISEGEYSVTGMKFYSDGALGSYGACLLKPYTDRPDQYGLLLRDPEYFLTRFDKLRSYGLQVATHAIGDSANRLILKIYDQLLKGYEDQDLRWRVEHCQVVHPEDLAYFKNPNIIPSIQPTHATSDMMWAPRRLGERLKTAYAYRSLLETSGMVALGTDFPVENISPVFTFYSATFRKNPQREPAEGFLIDQAISRQHAIKGMTYWAAYSMFQEHKKGDLKIGLKADLTVLNKNWLTCKADEILDSKVIMTIKNGKIVHKSK
ncbi:MAG: amidohydrolase [Thermaurantimonas sp.]